MKAKKLISIILIVSLTLCLSGCGCQHEWLEATCDNPRTCTICDATEGHALDHVFSEADCETPRTCTYCGITEGEALGHNYSEGYCQECFAEDPDYIYLHDFGYTNMYGMTTWMEITAYSFTDNYVEFDYNNTTITFYGNYFTKNCFFASKLTNNSSEGISSSAYYRSDKYQCNYLSNNSISFCDSIWLQLSIIDRDVDTYNSKVILKTLNHYSDEEWYVPCDMLDFTQITEVDDSDNYRVSFK